jgi:hypothetical protein
MLALSLCGDRIADRVAQARCQDALRRAITERRGYCWWDVNRAGRVVRKGQKGITIVAPVMGGDGNSKVVSIKPAWVFDVTQTDERTERGA